MRTQDDVRQFIKEQSESATAGKGTLAEWSRKIGRNDAYLHQFIHRKTPKKLDEADRKALAALMNVEEDALKTRENGTTIQPEQSALSLQASAPSALVIQEVLRGPDIGFDRDGPRDIPVLGTAMGGTEDDERPVDFWITGEIEDHVRRPKGLANARNVFVLHVGGDSMEPRYEERDMIYVQKTSPGIGDDVVIELHPLVEGGDHPTFLKRLVRRNGSFITVKQYNPPKELEFTMKEIRGLFRVIPLKELI